MIDALNNIPDISFIDDDTVSDILEQMISDFKVAYEEITGESIDLSKANPYRLIMNACSLQIYQTRKYIDEMGKQNLLKYAEGVFLDQIAALRGISRLPGEAAVTTIRFSLAETRESSTPIEQGVRVSSDEFYFETTEYAEIEAGKLYVDVNAVCTEVGENANGLLPGEINIIVDSVPFVYEAENTTISSGGTEEESDENFTDRIYLAPSSYSVAGPADAYRYFAKECNAEITDVSVTSPSDGVVDVRFTVGGKLPTEEEIKEVLEYLSADTRRPLTDKVVVKAPDVKNYNISLKYWIGEEKKNIAIQIKEQIEQAIESYKDWQSGELGRDINPSELIYRIIQAGAKRVEVTAPVFTQVGETELAVVSNTNAVYGGVENG